MARSINGRNQQPKSICVFCLPPHSAEFSSMPQYLRSAQHYAALLARYDTFLFDLDGVIWNGATGNDL